MTKNKDCTRAYSDIQETSVCNIINGQKTLSSGSTHFQKGDVVNKAASLLCECKTVMSEKDSFSIKIEWIEKNKQEMKAIRLFNSCVAFNFKPNGENYFVIDEKLMRFLVKKLEEFEE